MAIHKNFPVSPYACLEPDYRWFPADETLRETSYEKLLPPLVNKIRQEIKKWRDSGYAGASDTSKALLNWWFNKKHVIQKADGALLEFKYYFAQREAVETVIYLYEVAKVKDKYDLIRYDSSGAVSTGMFDEDWLRLVLKMATGSGKTKVISLVITWCYYHRIYEADSKLAANFLLIAPNIIVLDRLRAYAAKSNILPEKTLGRGLRRMYPGVDIVEYVSVVGTEAFMEFVESIQSEGVELEHKPMGKGTEPKSPIVIEIDNENTKKDKDKLDIEIPVMSSRIYREYKNLEELNPASFSSRKINYKQFTDSEMREIVFKDITTGEINHITILDSENVTDYRSVIGYFTQAIMKDLRLISGYDILYGKVKGFVSNYLFTIPAEIDSLNTLRNLSELEAAKTIIETFKKHINELTIKDKGNAEIRDSIKLRQTRPFVVKDQGFLIPQKSVFNKIVGDSALELKFASFLEKCPDIISYAKNYFAVHFNLDYVNSEGYISNYYPDFIVKADEKSIYIVETKGLEELDAPLKMKRLKQWCDDINHNQKKCHFDFVFVEEDDFTRYSPKSFTDLAQSFRKYKNS